MWNSTYTVKQLAPLSLGFNEFFNFAERLIDDPSFPKYNILKPTDTTWVIEMALAGYSKSDLEIDLKDGALTITHEKVEEKETTQVLYRGITKKAFSKSFAIAENIIVKSATFIDGLLTIRLEEIIPENKKSTIIKIS